MNRNDLGSYYTRDGRDIWRFIAYQANPSAMLENIETGERMEGSVDCLLLRPFIKLIPEREIPPNPVGFVDE